MKGLDYHPPAPKLLKWIGGVLGGVFTVIVVACVWMVVDLTRPARAATPAAAITPTPNVEAPAVPPALPSAVAAPATPPPDQTPASPVVAKKTTKTTHTKKSRTGSRAKAHSVLAKHESKNRKSKNDLDRLLGL